MSFFEEIGNLLGLDWARIAVGYSVVNYNGEAVYIEGIKKVVSLSDTETVFDAGKGRVRITGEGLSVFALEEKTAVIKGRITAVSEVV
ncbi:MAG: YabP/YqfC family sporulation protein [Firmicutes bacterium]|nr:YabP/YqfC family sporulation protein [Bacillota bacterium]